MKWRLIFPLTLLGMAMAFAGVAGLPGRLESLIWLIIFAIYAVIIVRKTSEKHFLHAFIINLINGFWIGIIHAAFISTYLANHRVIKGIYAMMPLNNHRRILMITTGVIMGVILGIISGLITFATGKVLKKKEPRIQP
jgi:hypothetical protein